MKLSKYRRLIKKNGGKIWRGGVHNRIYFNDIASLIGLDCQFYGTGNVSSATLDGEIISNTLASHYIDECSSGKLYLDLNDRKYHSQGIDKTIFQMAVKILKQK